MNGLILVMFVVGGLTRLTNSGLSIVDWRLLLGIIPPLSEKDWLEVFQKYQQFPEYQLINSTFTLAEFKMIYFWEYFHRLLGRLLGLYTLLPFLFLALKKKNTFLENKQFLVLCFLVVLQGLLGWFMVKSGLQDIPRISHFRLTLHLLFAIIYLSYAVYLTSDYVLENTIKQTKYKNLFFHTPWWILSLILLIIQIIYGAFMAGLDAGYYTSEYPKMLNEWIPLALLPLSFKDWVYSVPFVHFFHRHFAFIVLVVITLWALIHLKKNASQYKWLFILSLVLLYLQVLLGILTVVWQMPILMAILHQLNAILLLEFLLLPWFIKLNLEKNKTNKLIQN